MWYSSSFLSCFLPKPCFIISASPQKVILVSTMHSTAMFNDFKMRYCKVTESPWNLQISKPHHKACMCLQSLLQQLCKSYSYKPDNWRLFICSGKINLKSHYPTYWKSASFCTNCSCNKHSWKLLNNEHFFPSVEYYKHQWKICRDLKVICLVLGLQTSNAKNMYFLCLWNSRSNAEHCL